MSCHCPGDLTFPWQPYFGRNVFQNFKMSYFKIESLLLALSGRVFTSDFSGRLASDNRKSRENSYFSDSLKVKRVGKLQCNSH